MFRENNFLTQLVKQAKSGKYSYKEFISNRETFFGALALKKSLIKVCAKLNEMIDLCFDAYLAELKLNKSDKSQLDTFLKLFQDLSICLQYYSKELDTVSYSIREFKAYLLEGNLLNILLWNQNRLTADNYDHLKKDIAK